ncbi:MAG: hypothetical protein H6860_00930 [Rhodospirillales bacterium]|nr:hypothetical protein [Rhodospirillales bacterium]
MNTLIVDVPSQNALDRQRIGFAPYIEIQINKKTLDCQTSSPDYSLQLHKNASLNIYGDFIALYDGQNFLPPQKALYFLKELYENNLKKFETYLSQAMGTFWAILKTNEEISVYSSVRGPGLYIYETQETLHLNSSEKTFYKTFVSKGLDDFQVLHYITQHFAYRAPFKSLIKNTRHTLGGQKTVLKVDANNSKDLFYLPVDQLSSDTRNDKEQFEEFALITEEVLSRQYEYYKRDKNIFFEISGGIDSTMFLCAAKKLGLQGRAIHELKFSALTEYIQRLQNWLDIEEPYYLKPLKSKDNYEKSLKDFLQTCEHVFRTGLGQMGISNMYWHPDYIQNKPLTFGGHTIGVTYQNHPCMFPAFKNWPFQIWYKNVIKQGPKRYLYTQEYQKTLGGDTPFWLKIRFEEALPGNAYEYLSFISITNGLPLNPGGILPVPLNALENEFREYWIDSVLGPIVGPYYGDLKTSLKLPPEKIAQITRLIRFATNVQSNSINFHTSSSAGLINIQGPPMDGPMAMFLMKKQISTHEVKHPKNLEFMYFKHVTGKDYWKDFIPYRRMHNLTYKLTRQYKDEINLMNYRRNALLNEPLYQDMVRKVTGQGASHVLDRIENPDIKNYLADLYKQTYENPAHTFFTVNNILNLEYFLKGL